MTTVFEKKQSGNKHWWKITGTGLHEVSANTKQPIKPPAGNQPAHIDLPHKPGRDDPKSGVSR